MIHYLAKYNSKSLLLHDFYLRGFNDCMLNEKAIGLIKGHKTSKSKGILPSRKEKKIFIRFAIQDRKLFIIHIQNIECIADL